MSSRWLTFVLAGFSLIISPLAPADNLVDVYQLAETEDPELLGIIASYQATLEQYPQARAQLLPSLRFRSEVGRNFQDVTPESSSEEFATGKFQFTGEAVRHSGSPNPCFGMIAGCNCVKPTPAFSKQRPRSMQPARILGFG